MGRHARVRLTETRLPAGATAHRTAVRQTTTQQTTIRKTTTRKTTVCRTVACRTITYRAGDAGLVEGTNRAGGVGLAKRAGEAGGGGDGLTWELGGRTVGSYPGHTGGVLVRTRLRDVGPQVSEDRGQEAGLEHRGRTVRLTLG
ncbi:hypothetical protein [Kitasatospora sp. MMS16-BH015]|uniref:hypothetical protein n=1 Tax=Kitasatospora sp. MMS16-BH015 TaxID=2018025 RepID=UPI00131A50EA|nr:hypothetical protein [Kitasatospora sp. MMS16-BH015]